MENLVQFKTDCIQSSSNWNLANDVEFLKHLERFSEVIIKNANIAGKCMDDLENNLALTHSKIKNLGIQFQSVGDRKFIENLTHDEDETMQINNEKKQHYDKDNQVVINEKLDESLSTCMRLLEDKFDSIQLSESESDEDDEVLEHSQMMLKPRKCYVERPLPHIIGSYKFLSDSTLGLSLILQEHEDSTETEDEGANLFFKISQHNSTNPSFDNEPNSSSRKSLEDSVDSFEITSCDKIMQENLQTSKIISFEPDEKAFIDDEEFNESNQDQFTGSDSIPNLFDVKIVENKLMNEPKDIVKSYIDSEKISVGEDEKVLSKENLKAVLEKICSNPHQGKKFNKGTISEKVSAHGEVISKTLSPDHVFVDTKKIEVPKLKSSAVKIDTILPEVTAKTLHCLSKDRVKNKNKRRPPSRKSRSTTDSNETTENSTSSLNFDEPKYSISKTDKIEEISTKVSLLSPSTDEEDLFTVGGLTTIPSDTSCDRLFQPFTFSQSKNLNKNEQNISEPLESENNSIWDPFSENDDCSLFTADTRWNINKNPKNLLTNLSSKLSDDNLFTQSIDKSLFGNVASTSSKSKKINLHDDSIFDDTDEDSLFSSSTKKSETINPSKKTFSGLMGEKSGNKSLFKTKTDFLSDPLGFSQDCESDS